MYVPFTPVFLSIVKPSSLVALSVHFTVSSPESAAPCKIIVTRTVKKIRLNAMARLRLMGDSSRPQIFETHFRVSES
jgi:hypothetical protein